MFESEIKTFNQNLLNENPSASREESVEQLQEFMVKLEDRIYLKYGINGHDFRILLDD